MNPDLRRLRWVTPAKYVGPLLVICLLIGGGLAGYFVVNQRLGEAMLTLLFTICLLLGGIADLLGELIMSTAGREQSSAATAQ